MTWVQRERNWILHTLYERAIIFSHCWLVIEYSYEKEKHFISSYSLNDKMRALGLCLSYVWPTLVTCLMSGTGNLISTCQCERARMKRVSHRLSLIARILDILISGIAASRIVSSSSSHEMDSSSAHRNLLSPRSGSNSFVVDVTSLLLAVQPYDMNVALAKISKFCKSFLY